MLIDRRVPNAFTNLLSPVSDSVRELCNAKPAEYNIFRFSQVDAYIY